MDFTYINREISWLRFNSYVLDQAACFDVPLIEKLRFLGIYSNNLDEFYKVRYAYIFKASLFKNKNYDNITKGQNAKELLKEINKEIDNQIKISENIYEFILKELRKEDVFILESKNLSKDQKKFISEFFKEKINTTLGVYMLQDLNRFELKDGAFYLLVKMDKNTKKSKYGLIEVPTKLFGRFIFLPKIKNQTYLIFLEDILHAHLREIFSIFDFDKIEAFSIKITRDAEISFDNDVSKTFIEKISRSVEKRKKGLPVRMIHDKNLPLEALAYLKSKMGLDQYDSISPGGKYHNRKDLMVFPSLGKTHLEYKKIKGFLPKNLEEETNYFEIIDKKDQLLCFPYHDFGFFIKFLRQAALDPFVKSIQITIYRVAETSQVMQALIGAARNGKKVTVVLELRARFGEAHNIYWARRLQEAGIKIISGVVGLKVHAKLLYIERLIKNKLNTYVCISTGNFNEKTAKIYTDFILFSSKKEITKEIKEVFEFFGANYKVFSYKHLLVSPNQMRSKIEVLINQEIKNAAKGLPAYIYLKLNSLSDKNLIDKLYLASQMGVKINIQARSICSLIPGIEKLSKNIKAISLVDQFLEHSRVYWFASGGKDLVYISSADWMRRNLDFRLEVACPIYDEDLKTIVMDFLKVYHKNKSKARSWPNLEKKNDKPLFRVQEEIYNYLKKKMKTANYAAIDIGSNALRLLIMNVIKEKNQVKFYKNSLVRVPIRIGKEVFQNQEPKTYLNSSLEEKIISKKTKKQIIKAIKSYALLMSIYEVHHYLAYGTSAMREALNAKEIIDHVRVETGIYIEIISGEKEASLIFNSQLKKYVNKYETCLYIDVGGGSTELTLFHEGKKIISKSFLIGTVRILKEPTKEKIFHFELTNWITTYGSKFKKIALIATGGNINHLLKQSGYIDTINLNYLQKMKEELSNLSYEERIWKHHMKPDRADVILPALNLYLCIMDIINTKEILVPKAGLADGMIHYLYQKNPL